MLNIINLENANQNHKLPFHTHLASYYKTIPPQKMPQRENNKHSQGYEETHTHY